MGVLPKRIGISDARDNGASLRVTRHPRQRKVVLSHWRDGVCVASTPVDIEEIPGLIGVLVGALGEAARVPDPPASPPPASSTWSKLRSRFRPTLASVVHLPVLRDLRGDRATEREE
jgi:hypothetical protein